MKLIARVCADFRDESGNVVYRITPRDRLRYISDAPESIRDDILFRMLVADGSIEVIESAERKKEVESDPMAGMDASGKLAPEASAEVPAPEAEAAADTKTEPKRTSGTRSRARAGDK